MLRLLTALLRSFHIDRARTASIEADRFDAPQKLVCLIGILSVMFLASTALAESRTVRVDVDGNGRLDVLVADPQTEIGFSVFRDATDGVPVSPDQFSHLVVCDWNDDHHPDIMVLTPGQNASLAINQGDGQFYVDRNFGHDVALPLREATLADLGPGSYPSLIGRTDSATIVVVQRLGLRDYQFHYWWIDPEKRGLSIHDLNGDGWPDLVVDDVARLHSQDGWSNDWISVRDIDRVRLARLTLEGTEGNPYCTGAIIKVALPDDTQTYWQYPPSSEEGIELTTPPNTLGILVRWPEGNMSHISHPLDPGTDVTLFRRSPFISAASSWTTDEGTFTIRWQFAEEQPGGSAPLWSVVCTGVTGETGSVTFSDDRQTMEWTSSHQLNPGDMCILSYAGEPVSVHLAYDHLTKVLPIPIWQDTLPELRGFVVLADATGDGRTDLLAAVDTAAVVDNLAQARTVALPNLCYAPTGESAAVYTTDTAPFNPQRIAHREWWHVIRRASRMVPDKRPWAEGAAPPDLSASQLYYVDVTGDARLDILTIDNEGVLTVYQGTDGRPSGLHLCDRVCMAPTPAGPGDTVRVTVRNTSDQHILVENVGVLGDIDIVPGVTPVIITPGDTTAFLFRIQSGTRDDFQAWALLGSEDLDGEQAVVPFRVRLGIPPDAPVYTQSLELGVVQRDSVYVTSIRIPWVRLLPQTQRPARLASGNALAVVTVADATLDTTEVRVEFSALAIGDISLSYPLRNGSLTIRALAIDTIAPPEVTLAAEASGDTVRVSWTQADAADMDHYTLVCLEEDSRTVHVVEDTVFTETGFAEGTSRWYTVASVDVTGNATFSDTVMLHRPDMTPPRVVMLTPSPNETDVHPRSPVRLLVSDSLSGIALDSLTVVINGQTQTDFVRTGLSDSRMTEAGSAELSCPAGPWPMGERITVDVRAVDRAEQNNTTVWHGYFTTVADTIVPEIHWSENLPVLGQGGLLRAEVTLPSDRQLIEANLAVRSAGSATVDTITGTVSGTTVEVDIPPALAPFAGLFYRWFVRTDRRSYDLPIEDDREWLSWTFTASDASAYWPGSGLPGAGRALFATPILPEGGNALAQVLREISDGHTRGKLHTYDAERQIWVSGDGVSVGDVTEAALISWEETAPVIQVGTGRTVNLDSMQSVTLYPGWNLIGQPFPYPIAWRSVLEANPGLPVKGLWVEREQLQLTDIWDAWEGAWVYLASGTGRSMLIPALDAQTGITQVTTEEVVPWFTQPADFGMPTALKTADCLLRITAESEERHVTDVILGWHQNATGGYDMFDIPSPPSPDSLLIFRHRSPQNADAGPQLSVDIREPSSGDLWYLEVLSRVNMPVTLRFDWIVPPPPSVGAELVDLMAGDSLNIPITGMYYSLQDVAVFPIRDMAVVLGDNAFRQAIEEEEQLTPGHLCLFPSYPNPFNSETTISYSIPSSQDENGGHMRLIIYNMLGQHVRTLFSGPIESGIHTVSWNARNDNGRVLSSGVYFVELTYGSTRQLQRLIYLR